MKRICIFFVIILLVLTCGCSIIKPYTGEENNVTVQEPENNSLDEYKFNDSSSNVSSAASATSSVQSGIDAQSKPSLSENPKPSYTDNAPPTVSQQQELISEVYYANKSSKKFHKSTCGSAKLIKGDNLYITQNRDELIGGGYSPCLRCNP